MFLDIQMFFKNTFYVSGPLDLLTYDQIST